MNMNGILRILVILNLSSVLCAPGDVSFVVSSTEKAKENEDKVLENEAINENPILYDMNISSNITNRYAKTLITNKVRNPADKAKEATFSVILPQKAFISKFVMEIGGKRYEAYVKEKEEAKRIYDKAVSRGQSAAHVAVSARDSNRFTVFVNVEGQEKAIFELTYEELLERKSDQYEAVINIHPGQIVKHLNVQVNINETRPLSFVKTPSLRSGNEIKDDDKLDPASSVEIINSTFGTVKFQPDVLQQKEYAKQLGGKESDGFGGQFIVQYDVERDPHGGEVLLQDGYFVHFFAPKESESLPKNVYFILDTSSSMWGQKLQQLKDAISSILDEIKPEDTLNIIEFNSEAYVWDIDGENRTQIIYNNYQEPFEQLDKHTLPEPIPATKEAIEKAKKLVSSMEAIGGTYMIGGLETGLHLVKSEQERSKNRTNQKQPIIIFLTDGQPNIGVHSTDDITNIITRLNKDVLNVPIFSLSFGDRADKVFLRALSLKNTGFSRQIYEDSDASIQLQQFYKQISSPLLSNVHFKYNSDATNDLTQTDYPMFFNGGELVVSGRYTGSNFECSVDAVGKRGSLVYRPRIESPVASLERLWAYLTVRQTLEKREAAQDKTALTKKALKIALKYSFVTDITSLVVVKPNSTHAVDPEDGSRPPFYPFPRPLGFSSPNRSGMKTTSASYGSYEHSKLYFHLEEAIEDSDSTYNQIDTIRSEPLIPIPISTSKPKNTTVVEALKKSFLEESLKWLKDALNSNGTLTLPTGTFKLGNESLNVDATATCPKTPQGEEGVCSLLKDCTEIFNLLTDFEVYKQSSCAVQNEYAGVCCPKKTTVPV